MPDFGRFAAELPRLIEESVEAEAHKSADRLAAAMPPGRLRNVEVRRTADGFDVGAFDLPGGFYPEPDGAGVIAALEQEAATAGRDTAQAVADVFRRIR